MASTLSVTLSATSTLSPTSTPTLALTSTSIPTDTPTPTRTPIPTFSPEGENRDDYRVLDLSSDTTYTRFLADYEAARKQNAEWLKDPLEVVVRFRSLYLLMGKVEPNTQIKLVIFQANPQKMSTNLKLLLFCGSREYAYVPTESRKAIIIVIEYPCDDSVGPIKLRVELHQTTEGIWAIDWLGSMWKCARGKEQLKNFWHTTPCP